MLRTQTLGREPDRRLQRQSNFELLRIIAMLLIIASHFSVHGGFAFPMDTIGVNRLWLRFIVTGNIGVNIFVLISGYFLVNAVSIKTSKILKFYLQVFVYSVLLFAVFALIGLEPFGKRALVAHLFPVAYSQWWFASTYAVLYLLSPFFNRFLNGLDKRGYQKLLLLLTVCWCVIPTCLGSYYQSNDLLWFLYLYALAGYIRLHAGTAKLSGKTCLALAAAVHLLAVLSAAVFDVLGAEYPVFAENALYFYDKQRIPAVLTALFLFLGFMKIDIGYKKAVNIISSAAFGVYLIHEYPYMRLFLWGYVFKNASFSDSSLLIPYSIAVCLAVFCGSALIELLRIYVLERRCMPLINRLSVFLDDRAGRLFSRIFSDGSPEK